MFGDSAGGGTCELNSLINATSWGLLVYKCSHQNDVLTSNQNCKIMPCNYSCVCSDQNCVFQLELCLPIRTVCSIRDACKRIRMLCSIRIISNWNVPIRFIQLERSNQNTAIRTFPIRMFLLEFSDMKTCAASWSCLACAPVLAVLRLVPAIFTGVSLAFHSCLRFNGVIQRDYHPSSG